MTTSTTDGTPSRCLVCGKKVWLTPTDPPGDATCPHCGGLVWFDTNLKNDAIKDLADLGVEVVMDAEGEITTIRISGDIYDDSTVPQLAKIQDAETIDVRDTNLSIAGIKRLQELMPNVKIIHD